MIITIDGPAASGKSSVAKGVADSLNIPFISSGLLYRAATYLVLSYRLDASDEAIILESLAQHQVKLQAIPIAANCVWIDKEDITAALHTDDVDSQVSLVAKHPGVRRWVQEHLREVIGSFVAEGRDMGSTVFPHAQHKFYLTASTDIRARRRVKERVANIESIAAALKERDRLDAKQLKPASDAVHIDTSDKSLSEVIEVILRALDNVMS